MLWNNTNKKTIKLRKNHFTLGFYISFIIIFICIIYFVFRKCVHTKIDHFYLTKIQDIQSNEVVFTYSLQITSQFNRIKSIFCNESLPKLVRRDVIINGNAEKDLSTLACVGGTE